MEFLSGHPAKPITDHPLWLRATISEDGRKVAWPSYSLAGILTDRFTAYVVNYRDGSAGAELYDENVRIFEHGYGKAECGSRPFEDIESRIRDLDPESEATSFLKAAGLV